MAMQTYKTTEIETKIRAAGFVPLDILLVGATGVGKSSTLNALFGSEIAKVGTGADPETQLVESYRLMSSVFGIAQDWAMARRRINGISRI